MKYFYLELLIPFFSSRHLVNYFKFWLFFLAILTSFYASADSLRQVCNRGTVCTGPGPTEGCTTKDYCYWILDPSLPSSPPASPTPTPIRTDNGGINYPSPDEIARQEHLKFCRETPNKIAGAVQNCKNNALGYYGYYVQMQCPKAQPSPWGLSFTFPLWDTGALQVSYDPARSSPGITCSDMAAINRDFFKSSCEISGGAYSSALAQMCSDVK